MASQLVVSRLARPDKENVRSQGVFYRQGRLSRAQSWSKEGISVCMFDRPEIARWNRENRLSFLETPQCSDAAAGGREVGKLQVVQAYRSRFFQPVFHG